ncbi:helix-turn-helix transcriptional regulator [Streptomyces bambusae]|uniref:helix-turn-helix transcriptional regulator n=1 Tax=Streptomyces bambusae TaxID=1550616 RepID=UPI001CFE7B2B|nr:AraC family transcriptional regulator [Streptomyces bambusae]MCB5164980.1 helix-turn-helix transcriptional regulator [Streptomyces bambusae]
MQHPPATTGRTAERLYTRELDEAAAWMRSAHGTSLRMGAPPPGRSFLYRRDAVGPVAVSVLRLAAPCRYTSEPLGTLAVTEVRAGRFARTCGKDTTRAAAGDVMVASHPGLPYEGRLADAELRAVAIAWPTLHRVTGLAPQDARPRLTGLRPLPPQDAARWRRTVDYVASEVLTAAGPDDELLLDAATRLLAAMALSLFIEPLGHPSSPGDGRDAAPATVRRAVAFIEESAHRPIALADIAQAASVTPRALQYAFRRHLDTTPLAHLRRVRLSHAHEELCAADPGSPVTVTAVAARWGFLHQGRFAAAYRQAYGRTPGQTLRDSTGRST